ncbi:unnamed protein product [Owenia fusiformis]|uniref:Uncharacterized protein n=1 Tax=Owenia fusiformis TaxID=6347 RepID=A0A8J1U9P0_OWEFU|nr:unnamed protein product [Owenia fusiformis]
MLTLRGLFFLAFLQIDTLLNCLAVKGKLYNNLRSNRIPQDDTDEFYHRRKPVEDVSFHVSAPPRKKHLRQKRLKRIIGRDLNMKYASLEKPHSLESENKLKRFNNITIYDDGNFIEIDVSLKHDLELWLPRRGRCEIVYEWEDLGLMFWPRWIKRGHCDTSMSCSIPAGMHCVPKESKTIMILRWHCQTNHLGYTLKKKQRLQAKKGHVGLRHKSQRKRGRKDRNKGSTGKDGESKRDQKKRRRERNAFKRRGMSCKWLKVPYPVTSDCFCSC